MNNPNETDLLNLGIDFDSNSFQEGQALIDNLQKKLDALMAAVINQAKGWEGSAEGIEKFIRGLQGVEDALKADTVNIDAQIRKVNELTAEYKGLDQVVAQTTVSLKTAAEAPTISSQPREAIPTPEFSGQSLAEQGVIPSATAPAGGSHSAFGIGHALSVAGFTTGIPGLKEAGAFVYMEEGLKRAIPFLERFNEGISAAPGVFGPAIGALEGLGVPLAGLLTVAVPVAAAVAGLALVLHDWQTKMQEAEKGLQALLDTQDKYYKFIQDATTRTTQEEIAKLKDSNALAQKQRNENLKIMADFMAEGSAGTGGLQTTATQLQAALASGNQDEIDKAAKAFLDAWGQSIILGLPDSIGKAKTLYEGNAKTIEDNNIMIGRLTGNLKDNTFAGNDAAQAILDQIDTDAKRAQQRAADDKLSSEAAKERANTIEKAEAQELNTIENLKKARDVPGISASKQAEVNKEIETHQKDLELLRDEYKYVNEVAIPNAKALEAATAARNAENAALQTTIAFEEQVGRLKATGTSQTYESTKASLEGKIAGEQYVLDAMLAKGAQTKGELQKIDQLQDQIAKDKADLQRLETEVAPVIKAREDFKEAGKEADAAFADIAKAVQASAKAVEAAQTELANKTANAIDKEKQAEEQYTQGSLEDTFRRAEIKTKADRDEVKAAEDTANAIMDIRYKLSDKEQAAYVDYQRQLYDGDRKAEADKAKTVQDEQRSERDALVEHQQKLADIRRTDAIDQQRALLDRNFLQLAKDALTKQQQASQEDRHYTAQLAKTACICKTNWSIWMRRTPRNGPKTRWRCNANIRMSRQRRTMKSGSGRLMDNVNLLRRSSPKGSNLRTLRRRNKTRLPFCNGACATN